MNTILKHEKSLIISILASYKQLKFHTQLSWEWIFL